MTPCPVVLFILSVAFSLAHASEETFLSPHAPLWDAFGGIVRARVSNVLGLLLFFLGLTGGLVVVAHLAYFGSPFWCGVLVGARLGDCAVSHWTPTLCDQDVPGNWTTPLYVLEALWVLGQFECSAIGVVLGAGAFVAVLPSLWVLGVLQAGWSARRDPDRTG